MTQSFQPPAGTRGFFRQALVYFLFRFSAAASFYGGTVRAQYAGWTAIIAACSMLGITVTQAQTPSWSNGIIDYGFDSSNVYCAVSHNSAGETIGFWKDGSDSSAVYKLLKWNGTSWDLLSSFSPVNSLAGSSAQDDVSLAVDSAGGYHVAFRLYSNSADLTNSQRVIMYGYSADGSTWTFKDVWRTASSPSGYYNTDDPQVRVDSSDRPHIAFRTSDANSPRYYSIRHHHFNGTAWTGEQAYGQSGGGAPSNEVTKFSYQIDHDDNSHLAIVLELNGSGTDGSLAYLNNTSGSWSSPNVLAAGVALNAAAVNVSLVVDSENKIHIARQDQARALHYHTNTSGSFTSAQIGAGISGGLDHGGLAINSADHLFLGYNASPTTTNTGAVSYAYLTKGGSSWSTGSVFTGNSNTMRFWSADLDDDGDATILFDHFTGTGSPGTGNPRQAHFAIASIAALEVVTDNPPVVLSEPASSVGTDSAGIGGSVSTMGTKTAAARGVVYALASVNADPLIGGASVTQLVETPLGTEPAFNFSLSGLSADTAYAYKAYVTDTDGVTYYSPVATFSTNLPPVITSNGGASSASVSMAENSSAVTLVSSTDADAGHTISYSITGGTDAGHFTIDPSSGALTFVAAPDFEAPADADADNVYEVIVSATDNGNPPKSATQTLTVTVTNLVDNGALVLEQADGSEVASSGTVDFGSLTLGQAAELTFTLRSVGEAKLVLPTGMTFVGAFSSAFSIIGSLPSTLATGSSVTFTVRFSPIAGGSNTADLSFATNDTRAGQSPHVLNLSGTGLTSATVASYANAANAANQVRGGWINGTDFTIGAVNTNWNSNESPDKAVDNNTGTKFLAFRNNNAGLILSPTNVSVAFNRLSLYTANDSSERDPASYVLYGSTSVLSGTSGTNLPLSGLTQLASGTIVLPDNRSTGPTVVQFANTTAYASYIVAFPTVRSTSGNTLTQISEVQLSQGMNPTYPVAISAARGGQLSGSTFTFGTIGNANPGTNWNANESPDQAIDGNVSTKYLLFRNTGAGLIASPQAGPSPVNRLTFWTANDFAERDPLGYEVYGFDTAVTARSGTLNVGASGTLLGSGTLTLPATRSSGPETVSFNNSTAYASYLVVFPTVKNSPNTTMTQISEVQFSYNGVPALTLPAGVTTPVGEAWTAQESGSESWRSIACSSDGVKLAAVTFPGRIFTSNDSGVTWTARETSRYWTSIASSADGAKLAAVVSNGKIYTSNDSGMTWASRETTRYWSSIASSADGIKLAAVASGGQIYTSSDSGGTWTARETQRAWSSIASSADGTKLAAVVSNGQIYTSSDSGGTWTARENSRDWTSVASSADGNKLAAVSYVGQIYISSDAGLNWTARETNRGWLSIACSSDGKVLFAGVNASGSGTANGVFISTDSGTTWITPAVRGSSDQGAWRALATSADGSKLFAGALGPLYTSYASTEPYRLTVAEDSGSFSEPAFATGITPGIGDVGQTVSLAATNDNNALFSAQPVISADGTLTFTPAANAYGTATVTVIATDSTGLSSIPQSFEIEVTSVIDAPVLAAPTFSNVSAYSATMQGEILNAAVADYAGKAIMYAPTAANSTLTYYGAGAVTVLLNDASFSTTRSNLLTSGTSYSVRSCAYGPAGMIYSEVSTFTTAQGAPVMLDNTAGLSTSLVSLNGNGISTTQSIGYSFTTGSQSVSLSTVTLGITSSGALRLRLFESGSDSLPIGDPLRVHQEPARDYGSAAVYATFPLSDWQLSANRSYTIMVDVTSGSLVWRTFGSSRALESSAGWTSTAVVFDNYAGLSKYGTDAYPFVVQMTGTLDDVPPTFTHQELWRFANFGSYASENSGADDGDPDGDGMSNLLEYALGRDPNASGVTPASLALNGANLEYTYTRSSAARENGIIYQIEWSDTLEAGSWSTETVTQEIQSTQDALETVKASVPAGSGGKRFLRLRVVK